MGEQAVRRGWLANGLIVLAFACIATLIGGLVAVNPQLALVMTFGLVGATALRVPSGYWAIAAVFAVLIFRGAVTFELLPSVATYLDIPLAWGALAAALLRTRTQTRTHSRVASRTLCWLAALWLAMLVSWAFSDSEVLRPILYFVLLAEPFALIVALVIDPPSLQLRRVLAGVLLVLLVLQIPITFAQAVFLGLRDSVQGTLYGAGAGAHTISAVAVVGAIWIISSKTRSLIVRIVFASCLALIPLLADAKQVIFALPALLLVSPWRSPGNVILRVSLIAVALATLVLLMPAGRTSLQFIEDARSGRGGKQQAASMIWDAARDDSARMFFGQGPAQTVSRAAFMSTDLLLRSQSPIRALELRPATVAVQAEAAARRVSGGGSSFDSGLSSALGVFGDLGLMGFIAYLGLLSSVLLGLRKTSSPEGTAAGAGFAMFALLGFIFDWWEQPPFSIFLAVLAGLALADTTIGNKTKPSGVVA